MNLQKRYILYIVLMLVFISLSAYVNNQGSQKNQFVQSPTHMKAQVAGMSRVQNDTQDNAQVDAANDLFIPDKQTKFSDCQINGKYPDPACTPGAYIASATRDEICTSGYAKSVRDVKEEEKKADYIEYDITHHTAGEYEIDHFISLELGGSNDISNLFPEAAEPKPGFHEKDKVENYLHDQVCSGAISLNEAQREIATDWYAVYKKIQ